MDTNTYMPVAPVGGMGDFGSSGWWIILLFLFAGGFGNGFGFGGGGNAAGFVNADVQRGFDQSAVMNGMTGIQATINDLQNAINGSQMASLNRSFDAQTAVAQGFAALQAQLAQCCCDNRLATVQTQNVVQTEAAATRLAIENQTQAILDKMCAQAIENLRAANVNLQNQLNMANLAASQSQQTQQIIAALTPTV